MPDHRAPSASRTPSMAVLLDAVETAVHDGRTGTLTRDAWHARAATALDESRGRAALLLVDIDHFKVWNDRYGHLTGDRILGEVAYAVRSALRHVDLIGRWGGDELAVLLAGRARRDVGDGRGGTDPPARRRTARHRDSTATDRVDRGRAGAGRAGSRPDDAAARRRRGAVRSEGGGPGRGPAGRDVGERRAPFVSRHDRRDRV